jgi:hypothetical protein
MHRRPLLSILLLLAALNPAPGAASETLTPTDLPTTVQCSNGTGIPAPCGPADVLTYTWTVPHAAKGAGIVHWEGPGILVKQRGTDEWWIDHTQLAEIREVTVPGAPPIDYAWRPLPGDRYCVRESGTLETLGCVTVPPPPPTPRLYFPLVNP